tara:strand:+ start:7718 stop:9691 length:1974 start_codon:yes stop_codon:yes gene_type:complete
MFKKENYRYDIDGLRGIAVLAVIINHTNKEILPSGYLGVDIFFVISGFVITASLSNRDNKKFLKFISEFYSRRLKRLLPALIFSLLIGSLLISMVDAVPRNSLLLGLSSLFGISNLFLISHSTDYFGEAAEFLSFTHTWSLSVEEQFYFIFPFLIYLTNYGKDDQKFNKKLFFILFSLTISSLILYLFFYNKNQTIAYFSMPTRFWEMASGCICYQLYNIRKYKINNTYKKIPIFSILGIITSLFLSNNIAVFNTITIVFFTLLIIYFYNENLYIYKLLSNPKLTFIGRISYSLYLWHWIIICISRWTIGITYWTIPIIMILIYLISIFSYYYIEQPVRNNKNIFRNLKLSYVISLFSIGVTSLFLYALNIFTREYKFIYIPGYLNVLEKKAWDQVPCFSTKFPSECKYIEEKKYKNNFYMIGDSHAQQFTFIVQKALENSDYEYGYLDDTSDFKSLWGDGEIDNAESINTLIKFLKPNDVVGIAFVRYHLNASMASFVKPTHISLNKEINLNKRSEISYKNLKYLIKKINAKGAKVVLFRDNPMLKTPNIQISVCSLQDKLFKSNICDISEEEDKHTRKRQDMVFSSLKSDLKNESINIHIWDPSEFHEKIDNKYSYKDKNNRLIMIDQHHISNDFAYSLGDKFKEFLISNKLINQ